MSKIIQICKMFIVVLGCILLNSTAKSQDFNRSSLKERKLTFEVQKRTFDEFLAELSKKQNIPIGFQVTNSQESLSCKQPANINFQDVPLSKVMDSLIALCPSYTWTEIDGAINVFPYNKEKTILDTKIINITLDDKTPEEILDGLFDLQEMKVSLESNQLSRDTTTAFWDRKGKNPSKYSLSLTDKEVREIMNYIVVNTNHKFWIYYKLSNDEHSFSLKSF